MVYPHTDGRSVAHPSRPTNPAMHGRESKSPLVYKSDYKRYTPVKDDDAPNIVDSTMFGWTELKSSTRWTL